MNRSILIVIVDFLLVSLMAFSNLDSLTLEPAERRLEVAPVTTQVGGKQDLVGALKLALDTEQRNREKLAADLAKTRASVESQSRNATARSNSSRRICVAARPKRANSNSSARHCNFKWRRRKRICRPSRPRSPPPVPSRS